jgi:hypothetical protein
MSEVNPKSASAGGAEGAGLILPGVRIAERLVSYIDAASLSLEGSSSSELSDSVSLSELSSAADKASLNGLETKGDVPLVEYPHASAWK